VPAAAGVPPLARPTERGAVTAGWVWVVVAALALLLGVTAWALWRAVARLGALETARQQPDQALLLLQRDIQTARAEAHQARSETLATVKEELHQFASHMTQQMGQVGSGVQQQLQHVGQVVGAVQGSLGKLGEVTQRVFDVGRDIAGLEQLLKSPKIRGGVGETLLENLLAQMLPREQYALQHAFATGDRVDAAIRIGERIVPVDAKFPLENFRRVLEETDEDKRGPLRRAFLRDVKNRVDEIAKKYILPDEGTFDFALMYIPAENIYYEIIVRDDSEEDSPAAYALARRVVPVSPNTFYAYLRVIVLGLRGLRIERDAQEIQARLGRLRGDLDKFREAFDVVGRHLTNARNKYDDAASGLGRLEGKLEGIERHGEQGALPGIAP
jgi:DNA recombination protein RmuC